MNELLDRADLRSVSHWVDTKYNYYLQLVEKPAVHFPSTQEALQAGKNPFGVPSIAEWETLWKAFDCVTLDMIPKSMLFKKPIDLRHICLFYIVSLVYAL